MNWNDVINRKVREAYDKGWQAGYQAATGQAAEGDKLGSWTPAELFSDICEGGFYDCNVRESVINEFGQPAEIGEKVVMILDANGKGPPIRWAQPYPILKCDKNGYHCLEAKD